MDRPRLGMAGGYRTDAASVKSVHGDLESLPLLAEEVRGRDGAILEHDLH